MNSPNRHSLCLAGLLAVMLSACATDSTVSSPALEGRVIEASTHKPIPDALVTVLWKGHLGYTGTVCYHVETTVTDQQGHYRINAWSKPTRPEGSAPRGLVETYHVATVHKPGHEQAKPDDLCHPRHACYLLKPSTLGRGERLGYLIRVLESTRCGAPDESERNLHRLYKALFDEGSNLAVTAQEKDVVDTLRYWSTFVLFDPSKPSGRDEKGRLINIEPGVQNK
jgi:hypothetical protein